MAVLKYKIIEQGIEEFIVDLGALYPGKSEREIFEKQWENFFISDKNNKTVFKKIENTLTYLSESFIPSKIDSRPPLLLLFGNPATHSVVSKSYFSYEGNGREHRIWRIFRNAGLLDFESKIPITKDNLFNTNQSIKKEFFELNYNSPFRIGMAVYYSIPSTASRPPWSGVAGVQKLFGKKAIQVIETEEQKRIAKMVNNFLGPKGGVIAFQKDTYNGLKDKDSPIYSLECALNFKLIARLKSNLSISLIGVPPTRFLQGQKAQKVLENSINLLLS